MHLRRYIGPSLRSEFVTVLKIRDFFARKLFVFSGEIFAKSKKSQPLMMTLWTYATNLRDAPLAGSGKSRVCDLSG